MVYIILAEGFEEIEALVVADILTRANEEVKLVSSSGKSTVTGSHKIEVNADISIDNVNNFDMVVLPGGYPGYENLEKNEKVRELIDFAYKSGKYIAAICAAPSILGKWGYLKNKNAVCFPSFEKYLIDAKVCFDSVVCDGNVITSRGAGTAHLFAFKLVEILKDKSTADNLKESMLY